MDYSNACIYKIVCKDTSITDCYVGSTIDFTKRTKQHKYYCTNKNNKIYNYKVYQFIRENGGWDNFDIVLVEKVKVNDSYQLKKQERKYIEQLNATLNINIPTRTQKEWYEVNKDRILEKKKDYHEVNKDKLKEYYENNKDKILERKKERYENNKDKILKQQKGYQQANKEKISEKLKEKVNCPICNTFIRKDGLSRHQKSIKCLTIKNNI